MPSKQYRNFTGLDLRRDPADSDPLTVQQADNVYLTSAGSWKRRDGLRKICDLSSESVGLFSFGGSLHTVVPGGQSLQDSRPAEVIYDPIGDGAAYALGTLSKLHAVVNIGGAGLTTAYPYVSIERSTGQIEHHWLTAAPASAATAVSTKVNLPFDPGRSLIKIANKVWADDPAAGVLRFSSSLNGPTDWREPRDAGFLAVRQHAAGDGFVKGLSYFNNQLVVAFGDAIQLWNVFADPANNSLDRAIGGPGTDAPGSLANVLGDVVYFSRGGFRSLAVATVTGVAREGDIGAEIQSMTDDIDATTSTAHSLWSQARGQYICVFNYKAYVYTLAPLKKVKGWARWYLPFSVIDAIVEHAGELYIRANNAVYIFDPYAETDPGGQYINWYLSTQFFDAGQPGLIKRWKTLDLVQYGKSTLWFTNDPVTLYGSDGPTIENTTYSIGNIPVGEMCENLSLSFSGRGFWQLDAITLHFDVLRGSM